MLLKTTRYAGAVFADIFDPGFFNDTSEVKGTF